MLLTARSAAKSKALEEITFILTLVAHELSYSLDFAWPLDRITLRVPFRFLILIQHGDVFSVARYSDVFRFATMPSRSRARTFSKNRWPCFSMWSKYRMRERFRRRSRFSRFPLDERQPAKILSVQVQQVECEEQAFPPPEQQVVEHRPAWVIDAGDLAIDDGILDAQVLADPLREILEIAEGVAIPGNEIALAVLDLGERPETIDLQLEDVIVGVERFASAGKPYGA
jgi:hypothetical protein